LDHWRLCVTSANPRPRQRRERAPWRRRPGRSTLGRVTLPARWVARAHPLVGEQAPLWSAAFFSCHILIEDPPLGFDKPPHSWGGLSTTAIFFD